MLVWLSSLNKLLSHLFRRRLCSQSCGRIGGDRDSRTQACCQGICRGKTTAYQLPPGCQEDCHELSKERDRGTSWGHLGSISEFLGSEMGLWREKEVETEEAGQTMWAKPDMIRNTARCSSGLTLGWGSLGLYSWGLNARVRDFSQSRENTEASSYIFFSTWVTGFDVYFRGLIWWQYVVRVAWGSEENGRKVLGCTPKHWEWGPERWP